MVKLWDNKKINGGKRVAEIVPARWYYGKFGVGAVVLVAGFIDFHGSTKDAKQFFAGLK